MNTLETLYFPDTALLSTRQLPLLLLFSKVNIIQVVEEDRQSAKHPSDSFMDNRFCQALPLHPLANDRDRFLHLIQDIQNRKDDYAAQLSHLTLASLSEKKGHGDEAGHQIISSLLGRNVNTAEAAETAEIEKLWQARLVLKIGEILDREEEEVAQALLFLEDSEADVFNILKGESDNEDEDDLYHDFSKLTAKLGKPRTQAIEKRLRAWFRFIKDAGLPEYTIWSTTRQEVADILFENHEKKHGHPPMRIASIELPARPLTKDTTVLEVIENFHSECDRHSAAFLTMVLNASADLSRDTAFLAFKTEWKTLLDGLFPAASTGRVKVNFYRFSEPIPCFSGEKSGGFRQGPATLALFTAQQ